MVELAVNGYVTVPDNERHDLAQKDAKWFKHLGKNGSSESLTVPEICERYVSHLKIENSPKSSKDADLRFKRYVYRYIKLAETVTTYTIRHSVITDLIHGGLDTLTMAHLSGTSILMIEKHYGHLTQEHAKEALSRLAI